jgi:hypothetical protein
MSAIGGMRHPADYRIEDIAQGVAKMGPGGYQSASPGYGSSGYGSNQNYNDYYNDYGDYGSYAQDGTYGTDW